METNWYRTDLIDESEQVVQHRTKQQRETLAHANGVVIEEETLGRVKSTVVTVNDIGEQQIDKKQGTYVTLTVPYLTPDDEEGLLELEKAFVTHIRKMHAFQQEERVMIIGLGNKLITPDAIGPRTIDEMQQTFQEEPFVLYAPGVTGQSGLETKEFVQALVRQVEPSVVIVVDALATRALDRLCRTIQLTDTGIHPGSGVGNKRQEISLETIGVPVIAVGVPTVVEASVLLADGVERVFRTIAARIAEKSRASSKLSIRAWQPALEGEWDAHTVEPIFGQWSTWTKEDRHQLFTEVFSGREQFIVSPKECDLWVEQYATLISRALFACAPKK